MTSFVTAAQGERLGINQAPAGKPVRVINIAQFRNQNGTYDGAAVLAALTGLSYVEVAWSAKRIKDLLATTNMTRQQVVSQVREEAKTKPWNK